MMTWWRRHYRDSWEGDMEGAREPQSKGEKEKMKLKKREHSLSWSQNDVDNDVATRGTCLKIEWSKTEKEIKKWTY